MKKSLIVKIGGKVQNVGFRYQARNIAEKHRISGYVQNKPDGTVYIEAEGEEEEMDLFVLWCHKGPLWSNVKKVEVQTAPIMNYQGFSIR